MNVLTMYDAISPSRLPNGGDAYAGYVGGRWPDFPLIARLHPDVPVLSIAIDATEDAECLDVETGDASVRDVPGWVHRQLDRGVARPVIYTSQGNLAPLWHRLIHSAIPLTAVRIWSAHYGHGQHICSPVACQAALTAHGTQWNSTPGYDVSALTPNFFHAPLLTVVIPQPPNLKENRMLPVLVACSDRTHSEGVLAVHGDLVELVRTVADEQAWRAAGAPLVALSPAAFDGYVSRIPRS